MVRVPGKLIALAAIALLVWIFWQDILRVALAIAVALAIPLILLLIFAMLPGVGHVARSLIFLGFRMALSLLLFLLSLVGVRRGWRSREDRSERAVLPLRKRSGSALRLSLPVSRGPSGWRMRAPISRGRERLDGLVSGGLLVVGRYDSLARALIADILQSGRRVIVVGRIALLPETVREDEVRIVWLKRVRPNLLRLPEDRVERRRAVEELSLALSVAEGLDAAETGMVSRFVDLLTRSGATPTEEDLERLRTEFSTSSGRLKDPVALLIDYFGPPNLSLRELLDGGWRAAVIDPHGLSESLSLLSLVYFAQVVGDLAPDAVVVIEGAEHVIPDINVLPYDARTVWLRLYGRLERLAVRDSLVLLTSSPNFSPQLLDLARSFALVEPPVSVLAHLRSRLGVDARQLPHGPAAITRTDASWELRPLRVPEIDPIPVPVARSAMRMLEEGVRSRVSEVFRGTVLFVDFADLAEEAYRVLRAVRHMRNLDAEAAAREAGTSARIVRELLEKGYLAERDGGLVLTQLGEEAFLDFARKTGRLRAERIREKLEAEGKEQKAEGVVPAPQPQTPTSIQVGLGAYLSPPSLTPAELGDAYRMLSDAKAAFARQDYMLACRIAYKALITLLKLIAGVEKGKPKELARLASAKGVKVTEEETARAVSIISRISNLTKQMEAGEQLSNADRVWLESSAQFMVELVERILLTLEGLGADSGDFGDEGSDDMESGEDGEGSDGDAEGR
ncbi:MAG: hypothetical protein QXP81_10025 [Nitrososphaerota archaeon]